MEPTRIPHSENEILKFFHDLEMASRQEIKNNKQTQEKIEEVAANLDFLAEKDVHSLMPYIKNPLLKRALLIHRDSKELFKYLKYLDGGSCKELVKDKEIQSFLNPFLAIYNPTTKTLSLQYSSLLSSEDIENIFKSLDPNIKRSATKLSLVGCCNLEKLPDLREMTSLTHIDLSYCPELKSIQELESLAGLKILEIRSCGSLKTLSGLKNSKIEKINAEACINLSSLDEIAHCLTLTSLNISKCYQFDSDILPLLATLKNLQELDLSYLKGVKGNIPPNLRLKSLTSTESSITAPMIKLVTKV